RPCLVHVAEQARQGDGEADKNYVPDKIPEDRQSKQCFVRQNIVGRGRGVATDDEFPWNVKHAERRNEDERQINSARDPRGFLEWVHAISPLLVDRRAVSSQRSAIT